MHCFVTLKTLTDPFLKWAGAGVYIKKKEVQLKGKTAEQVNSDLWCYVRVLFLYGYPLFWPFLLAYDWKGRWRIRGGLIASALFTLLHLQRGDPKEASLLLCLYCQDMIDAPTHL